jgi:hypothetical protein
MEYFLGLSIWDGLLFSSLIIAIPSLIIAYTVRALIKNHLTKQHERIGRLLFRVTASLLALLISLSYANEKINYNKVGDSLEGEASLIAGVVIKLALHRSNEAEMIRSGLLKYVKYTIDDEWQHMVSNPYQTKMMGVMVNINILARTMPSDTELKRILKTEIIEDMDMITKTMQVRFYSTSFKRPYLIYITAFGLIISWCFFAVYQLDGISVAFLSIYNVFIAVLIYFVIMLGNPLSGPLKIDPEPFRSLEQMGLETLPF